MSDVGCLVPESGIIIAKYNSDNQARLWPSIIDEKHFIRTSTK
jgi:hypothetical protein